MVLLTERATWCLYPGLERGAHIIYWGVGGELGGEGGVQCGWLGGGGAVAGAIHKFYYNDISSA